ncbi:hypothetical protein F5Y16DRAFT_396153 [Xylariaceae sp. FL0255]|nr:hypothetical protein F5Y16DRAFT_396153 [Xylariaceae sp. FL0255]
MRIIVLLLVVALVAAKPFQEAKDLTRELSTCALQCLEVAAEQSACQTITNTTCTCTNGQFLRLVTICVKTQCSVEDALEVENVVHKACGIPERSRRKYLSGITAIEVFTSICICMRVYGRWRIQRRFEPEDYVMMAVGVLFVVFTVIGKYVNEYSESHGVWSRCVDSLARRDNTRVEEEPSYFSLLALTKISILCFFLRIFPNRRFRIAVKIMMTWIAVGTTVFILMGIFQCDPVNYNWEGWEGRWKGRYSCLDINWISWAAAVFVITHEMVIIALPIPLLLRLNVSTRRKVGIVLMFSLGVFVIITSCIRLRYQISFARSANATWDYTDVIIWTALEVNVSIITACLPAIRQLLGERLRALFAGSDHFWQRHTRQAVQSSNTAHPMDSFAKWRTRSVAHAAIFEETIDPWDRPPDCSVSTRITAEQERTGERFSQVARENPNSSTGGVQVRTTISSDVEDKMPDSEQEDDDDSVHTAASAVRPRDASPTRGSQSQSPRREHETQAKS